MRTGELYIFGDSLSDDGATAVQLQEEPIDLFFQGRASNGPVWHEYIRNDLAVAPGASSISQAPNFEGYLSGSDLNGINFAHAGAASSSDDDPSLPGALQQAQGFANLVSSGKIQAPDDQDVFVVWIGGNDFLQYADADITDVFDIFGLASSIMDNIEKTIETLAGAGATNFLLMGQPKIGGAFLGEEAPDGSFLAWFWNRIAERFNDALSDYADDLDGEDGQSALYVDIASFIEDLEDDPEAFGFSNVDSDILSDGAQLDDQSYFNVDGIHPTGAGHAAIANYVVQVAETAGFDLTARAGNVIPGSERADWLIGSDGPDTITGMEGNDTLDGGLGVDKAVFSHSQTSYTLTLGPNSITISDRRADGDGTDTLIDIEDLQFLDGSFSLESRSGAVSLSEEDFAAIVELYIAYFNRAPASKGLLYWADRLAEGMELPQIAESFFVQSEIQTTYAAYLNEDGSLANTDAFVTAVFNNLLGRDPSGPYWVNELDNNPDITPAIFILAVLNGARAESGSLIDATYLADKTDIGVYFSAIKGLSDYDDTIAVMNLFDGSAESVANAVAAIDQIHADALDPNTGEFLMPLVGVIDDPFALVF